MANCEEKNALLADTVMAFKHGLLLMANMAANIPKFRHKERAHKHEPVKNKWLEMQNSHS